LPEEGLMIDVGLLNTMSHVNFPKYIFEKNTPMLFIKKLFVINMKEIDILLIDKG